MADTAAVDTKEATTTTVATPEKKIVDDEKKKVVEDVDEDSKASENGEAKEAKENGSSEEKEPTTNEESKEPESTENGDSTDAPADACCIKRKSTATVVSNDAVDGSQQAEGASPEKKAKLDDKSPEAENNGGEAEAAA